MVPPFLHALMCPKVQNMNEFATSYSPQVLKIAQLGNPCLRRHVSLVPEKGLTSPEVRRLIDQMVETMRDAYGVGIAAPQVFISKAIITIEVTEENPRYPGCEAVPLIAIVNPVIESHSDSTVSDWEGCLSVPGIRGLVPRWDSLVVCGLDRDGRPLRFIAEGFLARIVHHEVDHLNRPVYLDRMQDLKTLTFLREFDQYWAKPL